jgi:hypothetical protein
VAINKSLKALMADSTMSYIAREVASQLARDVPLDRVDVSTIKSAVTIKPLLAEWMKHALGSLKQDSVLKGREKTGSVGSAIPAGSRREEQG